MRFLFISFLFLAFATSLGLAVSTETIGEVGQVLDSANKNGGVLTAKSLPKNVSQKCAAALVQIIGSPEFLKCIPIKAFLPVVPIFTDPKALAELLKDPVKNIPPLFGPVFDQWCPAPKCSDNGVDGALKLVEDSCAVDIKNNIPFITQFVLPAIALYSPVRDMVCFKNKDKEYCAFETLKIVFTLPPSPIKVIDGGRADAIAVADPSQVCTSCNKAMVNTAFNYLQGHKVSLEILEKLISFNTSKGDLVTIGKFAGAVKCGLKFVDGNVGDPGKGLPRKVRRWRP